MEQKINPFLKPRSIAHRSLKIMDCIEAGKTVQEIRQETGASRQLCEYYIKLFNQKDDL